MTRGPKIVLFEGHDGKWYFHKKSANGKIVGDGSQGYKEKRYAKTAIKREHPGLPVIVAVAVWVRKDEE
jgi:uncharacterized protein YegP (UPF0339 family)